MGREEEKERARGQRSAGVALHKHQLPGCTGNMSTADLYGEKPQLSNRHRNCFLSHLVDGRLGIAGEEVGFWLIVEKQTVCPYLMIL